MISIYHLTQVLVVRNLGVTLLDHFWGVVEQLSVFQLLCPPFLANVSCCREVDLKISVKPHLVTLSPLTLILLTTGALLLFYLILCRVSVYVCG